MDQSLNNFDFISGEILLFNKPLDWTSFDVVNRVRYLLCQKLNVKKLKVGHAGTLDPKATGLVLLCTGKATKKIETLQVKEKEYIATIKFGATTPSFDLESEEDQIFPTEHITLELIEKKLENFIGEIDQVPPVFSAIKVKGKRAFDYAREGLDLELKSRKVTIYQTQIVSFKGNELVVKINCGKGTYIRSLARDLGKSLNSGAYLIGLQRTQIGDYHLNDSWDIEKFEKSIALM